MDARELRNHIEGINALPTIPGALRNIVRVIENPRTSLSEIGSFISKDPVLVSRVLKVVNSPIYGFSGRISSVNQALLLLGLSIVRGMLFGVSVFEIMEKTMVGLWGHSMGCAVAARIIAQKKGLEEPEEISVAALLHDIGKVAFSLKFPEDYGALIGATAERKMFLFEAEEEHFGVTHAKAGAWICEKWNFPRGLVEMIGYHHKPHLSKNVPVQTAVVHLADALIRAKGFGFGGDNFVPPLSQSAWRLLDLAEEDLREIVREVDEALAGSGDFLFPDE